jgi:RNA polymerase sigma factor (sigma-70 family)
MGEQDGNDLVARWRAAHPGGEREAAFRRIFERSYRPVVGFFHKRGFSPEDCEELAQETFYRVYKSLAEFRGASRFDTWLFQIAANLYRNTLRDLSAQKREGKEVPLDAAPAAAAGEIQLPPAEDPSPLAKLLEREREEKLREAIDGLPPQMRRCVELRVAGGLKYREIAEVLHISVDTVKAHLLQARQRLRAELGDYYADLDFR